MNQPKLKIDNKYEVATAYYSPITETIYLNLLMSNEVAIKFNTDISSIICFNLSHEFLHHWIGKEISDHASNSLDRIIKTSSVKEVLNKHYGGV